MTAPYTEITACRICGNTNLAPVIHLGTQALTGVFPKTADERVTEGPVELVKCHSETPAHSVCDLLQLRQTYRAEEMYGENYGYRSGLNRAMVRHLKRKVDYIKKVVVFQVGDLVIDIGSNDGTLLGMYSTDLQLLGIDPSGAKFAHHYPPHVKLVPEFFSPVAVHNAVGEKGAKVVTSIAMLYDLEDPLSFAKQVASVLEPNGVWVFEQSYMPTMVEKLAYDTICHEHLLYLGMRQVKWMLNRAGLKIIDYTLNDTNGGSFSVTACLAKSRSYSEKNIDDILEKEAPYATLAPYQSFARNIEGHRDTLCAFVRGAKKDGKRIYGYGASTKGNVLLQYCGLTPDDLPCIAEVNEDKFRRFTPGSKIPIVSEKEARSLSPDYFLVLPWHFKDEIVRREQVYLRSGGKLVLPLPRVKVIDTKVIPSDAYQKILETMPLVCVDIVVHSHIADDRVLLLKRKSEPAKGEWWTPGGRVLFGETRIAAAKRKLDEECGLDGTFSQEAGTHDVLIPLPNGAMSHAISSVFHVLVDDQAVDLDDQSTEYAWRTREEWAPLVTNEFVRKAIGLL